MEVIEFARSHPSQFTLSSFSEGRRVCQFYYPTKQLRVQISEEDFLFINSGRCQELIPPLPIWEDEEKEVATCEVLEEKLKEVTQLADMVAARTRQVGHRLKGRRQAVAGRRKEGGGGTPAKVPGGAGGGFVAVNGAGGNDGGSWGSGGINVTSSAAIRGELLRHFESLPHNQHNARPASRHMSANTTTEAAPQSARNLEPIATTLPGITANPPQTVGGGGPLSTASSLSPVPANFTADSQPPPNPSTTILGHRPSLSTASRNEPANSSHTPLKHNFSRPLPPALESSQPFRPLCQAHMDSLPRGHRVIPPCDRCRRLRMDCVKNLTSCAGCTRKHARCHWRDVDRAEVEVLDEVMGGSSSLGGDFSTTTGGRDAYMHQGGHDYEGRSDGGDVMIQGDEFVQIMDDGYGDGPSDDEDDEDSNPLEDLDKIGEQEEARKGLVEDEEGLRNARELSRAAQAVSAGGEDGEDEGREGGERVVGTNGGANDTPQGAAAASDIVKAEADGVGGDDATSLLNDTAMASGAECQPTISNPPGDQKIAATTERALNYHHGGTDLNSTAEAHQPIDNAFYQSLPNVVGNATETTETADVAQALSSTGGFRAVNG